MNNVLPAANEKLTDWKKEPSVLDLRNDLFVAQPSHDMQVKKVRRWLDILNTTGEAAPKAVANRSSVQPRLVRRNNEWRYSALSEPFLSSENVFTVNPTTWEDKAAAEQNGQLINYQFRTKIDRVKFVDEYVRTTVDEGTCYVKPGWCQEPGIEEIEVPVYEYRTVTTQEEIDLLQQAIGLMQENPQGFSELPEELQAAVEYTVSNEIPVMATEIGRQKVKREKLLKNQPTLEIVNFENVYLDPSCEGDLDKAHFAVITFETNKAALLKDPRYKNLDKVNWGASSPLTESHHATMSDPSTTFKDDLRKPVVAYEYWGFYDVYGDETLVPIVATWIGDTMIRMEENPYPDQKIPLVLVPYLPVKRSLTGEPDAELLGDNQKIIGALTRGMIDLMGRSANGQIGMAKGMLDAVNRRRFEQGKDYEFNMQMHVSQGIYQHTYPEIPNSALTMLSLQNQEAEAMSGVKSFSGGISGTAFGDVAANTRAVLDAAAKREMSILRRLASGMEKIGKKLISMNQAFLSEEEVVQVTNEQYVKILREDIQGEYNIVVDIATAEVDEAKAQDLGFMLQTMGNTLPFEMTQMILVEIAKLKRMPTLAKMIEKHQPQPDPLAQKLQELEIAKLEMEIAEIQAETQLKLAKAREVASTADNKDLDFLEQETGTKHARDMQKIQAQAESNQMLEITKGVLAPPEKRPSDAALLTGLKLHEVAAARV